MTAFDGGRESWEADLRHREAEVCGEELSGVRYQGEAAPRNPVPAVRSDSRSGPEGGRAHAGETSTRKPPQSRAAPQARRAGVTAGRDRQPAPNLCGDALGIDGAQLVAARWRSLWLPLLPIALALGMLAGVMIVMEGW